MSDHYAPHPGAKFEGWYSKFTLSSGWSVCLIISSVPAAARQCHSEADLRTRRPYYICLTYVSPDSTTHCQKEYWPLRFDVDTSDAGFKVSWGNAGYLIWDKKNDVVSWKLEESDARFTAETNGPRTPWARGDPTSTPAGLIASLPSPIQWHVQSLSTPCAYTIDIDGHDKSTGEGYVHHEKNWAVSFPNSYIWLQARDDKKQKGLCLAGGSLVPGVQAYLVGYQGERSLSASYIPWSILGLSPTGLTTDISYPDRRFNIDVKGWFRRLKVTAQAPDDTFFTFAAPLDTGHKPDYTVQSYGTRVEVEVMERSWPWEAWRRVEREVYERGALEFGGDFYKSHSS